MGWAIGIKNGRWIGYGVPATCDQSDCGADIDRGLGYLCGDGEQGCGLFFCGEHLFSIGGHVPDLCRRCLDNEPPFEPTEDTSEWNSHILSDATWEKWRTENQSTVLLLQQKEGASRENV